ncbi:MAG: EAL domain-containing protein [Clostridia bacterium]|nr:EAL domain-containing protein [Clostridia bacterium]
MLAFKEKEKEQEKEQAPADVLPGLHRYSGKRSVLVVDDEAVNREMLSMMLSDVYDVLCAADGEEALEIMRREGERLSLVLLDVRMPKLDGFAVMEIVRGDERLRRIPIIVLTSERSYEVRSLRLGATDFIKKPYDEPEVILARVERIIELSESTTIISHTERDRLTGLFHREYFFQYVEQYDLRHAQLDVDAVQVDVYNFRLYNALYGHDAGTELLRRLGGILRDFLRETEGFACRQEADVFLLYVTHREDYDRLLGRWESRLAEDRRFSSVRLRAGVCPHADKHMHVQQRFDCAKAARETLGRLGASVAVYDSALHERELFARRLLDDMDESLADHRFKVYYQPKYNVTGSEPVLSSAEALVRWDHPDLGMVSPGVFVPLFEENGLISSLDRFVWREAARQIRLWRDRYGVTLPVSVNVSRMDMYDDTLTETFLDIVRESGLSPRDLLIEITESAYTDDAGRLIAVAEELRRQGFLIEMDDFGAGYSSLNMLAQLPIDVLKLDMSFVRHLRSNPKNLYILRAMIDIKEHLGVPMVAEGVEDEEQLKLLKEMGCDVIQGYLFSPPVPPEKFEKRIESRTQS